MFFIAFARTFQTTPFAAPKITCIIEWSESGPLIDGGIGNDAYPPPPSSTMSGAA